jgi:SAM-dependent methyltransferase
MAHFENKKFFSLYRKHLIKDTNNLHILEIGSYDVNGSIKNIFLPSNYIGCDISPGKNVDIVSFGHELNIEDNYFDLVISSEVFEHDRNYKKTFENMYRMLKPSGTFLFTCAGLGRIEHGTSRTNPSHSPGNKLMEDDYYKNLSADDFCGLIDGKFHYYEFIENKFHKDLYFFGIKSSKVDLNNYELSKINNFIFSAKNIKRPIFSKIVYVMKRFIFVFKPFLPQAQFEKLLLMAIRFQVRIVKFLGKKLSL